MPRPHWTLVTLAVLSAGVVAAASSASAEARPTATAIRHASLVNAGRVSPTNVSSNWAGYAVSGSVETTTPAPDGSTTSTTSPISFTSVTGTWVQPKADCSDGRVAYSSVWVGLGGFDPTSNALEQIGTDADCTSSGKARYLAWYEIVPAPSVPINLKVRPGDTITTSVNVSGTSVLVQIKNRTTRKSFTKRLDVPTPDLTSAEWIVEAPSGCTAGGQCRVLPLANFGSVSFTRAATIGNALPGTISNPAWTASAIELIEASSATSLSTLTSSSGAIPGDLTPDGRGFVVSWAQNLTAPAP